jgi:catechol 2,3-dioxygenase-like lactoylglutathione lyase family enzyme
MVEEARLERVASGLAPVTPGWFVVNAREAAWMNNDQTESCCIFESDEFVLLGRPDLTAYEKPGAGFDPERSGEGKGAGVEVHIKVDDVEEFHSGVVANGLTPASEPQKRHGGGREFVLRDPDGYRLVFLRRE